MKKIVLFSLTFLLLISACTSSTLSSSSDQASATTEVTTKPSPSTTTRAITVTSTEATKTTLVIPQRAVTFNSTQPCTLRKLGRTLVQEWNAISGQLIDLFLDSSISSEAYVGANELLFPILRSVGADLMRMQMCLPPDETALLNPLLPIYGQKLDGYHYLATQVGFENSLGVQKALDELLKANQASLEYLCVASWLTYTDNAC